MSQQPFPFYETQLDALGADVAAAGGFKVVAGKLWPADPRGDAKLRNCLNPNQPHELGPEEVLQVKRIAYAAGATNTIDYEAQQMGYVVTWIEPEAEQEKLLREARDLLLAANRNFERIEKAKERAALKVVR